MSSSSDNKRLFEQLVAVVKELEETCKCIRHNTEASKLGTLLMKRHSQHMRSLLLQHGVETLPACIEENGLLVEQNEILLEERETMARQLQRLQARLNALGSVAISATPEIRSGVIPDDVAIPMVG